MTFTLRSKPATKEEADAQWAAFWATATDEQLRTVEQAITGDRPKRVCRPASWAR